MTKKNEPYQDMQEIISQSIEYSLGDLLCKAIGCELETFAKIKERQEALRASNMYIKAMEAKNARDRI